MKNKSSLDAFMEDWKESIEINKDLKNLFFYIEMSYNVHDFKTHSIDSYKDSNGVTHYVINKKYVIYEIQEKKE